MLLSLGSVGLGGGEMPQLMAKEGLHRQLVDSRPLGCVQALGGCSWEQVITVGSEVPRSMRLRSIYKQPNMIEYIPTRLPHQESGGKHVHWRVWDAEQCD